MRNSRLSLVSVVVFVIVVFFFTGMAYATSQSGPKVADGVICVSVVNLECINPNTRFDVQVGKLYCLTRITGAEGSGGVIHVWYFEGKERARVKLDVHSDSWRTYSSKIIQPHEVGVWHVDILLADGMFLETIPFETLP